MKLTCRFSDLGRLVEAIGAAPVSWTSAGEPLDALKFLVRLRQGIDVGIDDVAVTENGMLALTGQPVLLYIKDTRQDRETLLGKAEKVKRFHVVDCETLETMRRKGRFERYVATSDTSGVFRVDAMHPHTRERREIEVRLRVCRNCLAALDFEGYRAASLDRRHAIWREFSLAAFFERHTPEFKDRPRHTDNTASIGGYGPDWDSVSRRYRKLRQWTCESCGVDLRDFPQFLHTHHRDGVTTRNAAGNLRALCVLCHRRQPDHHRVHVSREATETVRRLQRDL
jgi:hypothetical protein